jgi:hypothetical protein
VVAVTDAVPPPDVTQWSDIERHLAVELATWDRLAFKSINPATMIPRRQKPQLEYFMRRRSHAPYARDYW